MQTSRYYGGTKSNQKGFGQPLSFLSPGLAAVNDLFYERENEQD